MKYKVEVNKWKLDNGDCVYYLTKEEGKDLVDQLLSSNFDKVMEIFRKIISGISNSEWKLKIVWEVEKK